MKHILCLVVLLSLNFIEAKSQERAPVGEEWKLTESDKKGMLDRLNECGVFKPCNNNSKVIDLENDQYKWIVANYGETSNITTVEARYRKEDEDRYARLRGFGSAEKGKVKGCKTMIVKVEPKRKLGSMDDIIYFDCFTVCPPPDTCN